MFFRNDALLAAPFAVDGQALSAVPIRVVEDVAVGVTGGPMVALSHTGTLMYASSTQSRSRVVWVSHHGLEETLIDTPRLYESPRLSPAGDRLVITASGDLWIQDTVRATFTRLTSNETAENSFATWTPDGKRVIFRTQMGLRWIDADGSGRSGAIAGTTVSDFPSSASPDGLTLAFTRITPENSADVLLLSLDGEPRPRALVTGPAYEGGPQYSPDGRWLAYASDESGASQVYVRPYPGPNRRWLVSLNYASWNQLDRWLRQVDGLRHAA